MDIRNLHDYQKTAVKHILSHTHCGLFLDMGLGKTVSTLTAIEWLMYQDLSVTKVLVVAPKRVAESVWGAEVNKWDHLKHLRVSKIIGTEKQRRTALATQADIYTIGRDNVAWLCGLYGGSRLPFDMLVIDELSSFKNPKSQRFKALRLVQPCFSRVVGLTGTPAPNGLIDLWSQIYLLDRGQRLGKFISHFRDQWFIPGKRNGMVVYSYVPREGAEEQIHKAIGDICMSMKAEDYLQLPGRIDNIVRIQMPEDIQAEYDKFEQEKVLELVQGQGEDVEITTSNAAVLSMKLLQFANGSVYDEFKIPHKVHDLKIDAAKELVEDAAGQPVLIAWTFTSDRDRLLEALKKYNPRELKTDKDIQEWNEGKIQVLLMHPASGGHGLNLQAGGHRIIWFGQTWSLELEQQFNARLDRQGQKEVVIINRLVCCNTIDQDVIEAQKMKAKTQEALMQAVKSRVQKYMQKKM